MIDKVLGYSSKWFIANFSSLDASGYSTVVIPVTVYCPTHPVAAWKISAIPNSNAHNQATFLLPPTQEQQEASDKRPLSIMIWIGAQGTMIQALPSQCEMASLSGEWNDPLIL